MCSPYVFELFVQLLFGIHVVVCLLAALNADMTNAYVHSEDQIKKLSNTNV